VRVLGPADLRWRGRRRRGGLGDVHCVRRAAPSARASCRMRRPRRRRGLRSRRPGWRHGLGAQFRSGV